MSKYSSLRQEEYAKKKQKKQLIKVGVFFLLCLLLIGLLAWIAHRPSLRISVVELQGGILVTPEEVSAEATQFISGSYMWIFPKNNSFLYPHKKLEQDLKNHFQRIDAIEIVRKNFHTLVVQISERKAEALWCEGEPDQAIGTTTDTTAGGVSRCYFIDANSTIFAESPQFSGDAYFKYYGLVATDTPIGTKYMASSTDFADLSAFVSNAKRLQTKPEYLIAKGGGEFTLVVSGGGEIYFDNKESLAKVADNLEALLRTPQLAPTPYSDLPIEYIDLRFGNKLFYKLK